MKNIHYSKSFEELWRQESETRTSLSNKLFCITFLVCNPASSIAFYLAGDPFFFTLIYTHTVSGIIILTYMYLHHKKVISGQQMSFFTMVTLVLVYSFLLSLPHLSYVQSCVSLTLAIIFAGLVLRWPLKYAVTVSILALALYPGSIHFLSNVTLARFFEEGGVFVIAAHALFPFVIKLNYNRDKREFFFRYTLGQQNEALEKQKNIAESAMKAKTDFLSMMSHEIRTPLNGIVGMVHLMMQDDKKDSRPDELLQTLKFSADHLMAVVNDVLDFNKINSNHVVLDPHPFNTFEYFENLRNSFAPRAAEKGIELLFEIDPQLPPQLTADKVRLNQVVTNLVHNAVKFTEKGFVRLRVTELERSAALITLAFEVRDSGIGIPKEQQTDIFEIFTQVRSKTHSDNVTGTGLGLAISKELLRLFHSTISLESEEGQGAVFSFQLKLPYSTEAMNNPLPEAKASTTTYPSLRVLVADDNKTNLVLATQLLKRKQIMFDTAGNGQEAYDLFLQKDYDLVLMDLRMPVMDGFESTTLIRKVNAGVPVIALTASAFENEKERAMANGFSGYLTKPFIPQDFYNYIFPFLGISTSDAAK